MSSENGLRERLRQALRSRGVVMALSALLVTALLLVLPDLEPVRGELLTLLATLGLAVLGGYSLSDAARTARERNDHPPHELRDVVKELLIELLDEIADAQSERNQEPEEQVNV